MTTLARRPELGRWLVDSQRHRLKWGDAIVCGPGDVVWIRAEYSLIGWLGPGHYQLGARGVHAFLEPWVGNPNVQLMFVVSDASSIHSNGIAFAFERDLRVVAELAFELDVDLSVTSFPRLHSMAKGMLDYGSFQDVIQRESGVATKKAIEEAAADLSAEELLAFGSSRWIELVERRVTTWWERYALAPARFELSVIPGGALLRAVESEREGGPVEVRHGERVQVRDEDGRLRTGVVVDIVGPRVQLYWDVGGAAWVRTSRCQKRVPKAPVNAGTRVYAFSREGTWQPATALRQVNGWWDVRWDAGPRAWLAPAFIRFPT